MKQQNEDQDNASEDTEEILCQEVSFANHVEEDSEAEYVEEDSERNIPSSRLEQKLQTADFTNIINITSCK